MTVLAAGMALTLAFFLVAGVTIARLGVQRDEYQAQADAYALGAATIAERDGIDAVCNNRGLVALVQGNSRQQVQFDPCPQPRVVPQADGSQRLVFEPQMSGHLDLNFFGDANSFPLRSHASSAITQVKFDEAERHYPEFVLVTDYSGSMATRYGGRTRIEALRSAVTSLLDAHLRVEYGLVMFNNAVIRTLPIDLDNQQQDIRDAIRRREGGGTNYVNPMRAAINLLQARPNHGYYILFISDGEPNEPPEQGEHESDLARAQDITVFTLAVGDDSGFDVLKRMAGPPGHPGDIRFFYQAHDDAQLQQTFRQIVSSILCTVGPLQPAPGAADTVYAFLHEAGGGERPLPVSNDLDRDHNRDGFQYVRAENKIHLTERSCDDVIDRGGSIITRFGSPRLIQ